MTDESVGERIRYARIVEGWTLRGLAHELELSPSYLCDIEYDRRVPSNEVLRKIADSLGLNLDTLLAAAGRVGITKDDEQYIRETPSAGILFRRVVSDRLTEGQIRLLLDQVKSL